VHDEAPSFEATDWQQIVALYDVLRVVAPSPLVHLNRARGGRQGPRAVAGLELLNELADVAELRLYYLLPSAGARVLEDLGRLCEVPDAYRLAGPGGQRCRTAYLRGRLMRLRYAGPVADVSAASDRDAHTRPWTG
jgi:RNA polymerase sigma-70 factor (ECF subfamily)